MKTINNLKAGIEFVEKRFKTIWNQKNLYVRARTSKHKPEESLCL